MTDRKTSNSGTSNRLSLSLVASLSFLAACGGDSSEGAEPLFATWTGTWQAVEPLFRDDAFDDVVQAIRELRPEYSVDEIEALFVVTAEVDYTALEVASNTLAFFDGSRVVCSGRYQAFSPETAGDENSAPGPEDYTDFTLTEEVEGDCASYASVSLSEVLEQPGTHFHVVTGTPSGPLNPPPWNPSVWPETMTTASFAELFLAAAPGIANSLPER